MSEIIWSAYAIRLLYDIFMFHRKRMGKPRPKTELEIKLAVVEFVTDATVVLTGALRRLP